MHLNLKLIFTYTTRTKYLLTHFSPVSHFYTPLKRQKTNFNPDQRLKTFLKPVGKQIIKLYENGKYILTYESRVAKFQFDIFRDNF